MRAARIAALIALCTAAPAAAQLVRVPTAPAVDSYALYQRGDTVLAGVDDFIHVSLDRGATWTKSSTVGTVSVDGLWVERGRLWAGTYGFGVLMSTDLGVTWQPASTGLAGGVGGSHLAITEFVSRGDSLYAATDGAGVFVKHLGTLTPWTAFGAATLVSSSSGGVQDMDLGAGRIVVGAEANGAVHTNDRGSTVWTRRPLDPGAPSAGLQAGSVSWSGTQWFAATQAGVYRSPTGGDDWERIGPAGAQLGSPRVAAGGARVFASFSSLVDTELWTSPDAGENWQLLGVWPTYTADLELRDSVLHVARGDGVWRLSTATLDAQPPATPPALSLALDGPNPVHNRLRLRFSLPAAAPVRIALLDAAGREVTTMLDEHRAPGVHALSADLGPWRAGVYFVRLETPAGALGRRVVHLGARP